MQRGAGQAHVSLSYVTRVMHLAFFAPDIVERVTAGEGPSELTADRMARMARMGPLLMAWAAQR